MGGHALPLLVRPSTSNAVLFLGLALLAISNAGSPVSGVSEAESLLKLKSCLSNPEAISNWNPSIPPCSNGNTSNWVGVLCINGNVWALQLENMGLGGEIDVDALSKLPELKILSLMRNDFKGQFPNFSHLTRLRGIYLSHNHFSGHIPDNAFVGMSALRKLFLANNAFSGNIPSSLATVPKLVELKLEDNQFKGNIPDFQQQELPSLDVANNQLEGPLPWRLNNMTQTSFRGNKGLCGPPLDPCPNTKPPSPKSNSETPDSKHKSLSNANIIVLAVCLVLLILLLIIVVVLVCRSKQEANPEEQAATASQDGNVVETNVTRAPRRQRSTSTKKRANPGKLEFLRDDRKAFGLNDLLTGSAEVLESGNFESSYKVEIFAGEMLVVKRFRQMTKVGREDFDEHMRRMGRLRHPNLLGLVAYYYWKEEKLLVFDFVDNGNLASHLYGNHPCLDWPTRLKIIKGVARGMAYLYSELPTLTVPHGYLKSSNVLLNESYEPFLMDYALLPLIDPEQAKHLMVAYKSPEYTQHDRLTKKTDVWSLGILILEVLTGKVPPDFLTENNAGGNLISWVKEIAKEEKADDLFDKEMGGTQNVQGEMRKLLNIGFSCCQEDVEIRCTVKEVIENIEDIKETETSTESITDNELSIT